jgi:hypothetical protein
LGVDLCRLAHALAWSWADQGVRVHALAPGWFPSAMTDAWVAHPALLARVKQQAPLGRLGRPAALAEAWLCLTSDASCFVTGQTLVVDEGGTASRGALPLTDTLCSLFAQVVPDSLGTRIMLAEAADARSAPAAPSVRA